MNDNLIFPFRLVNAFFINLSFERPPALPDPYELALAIEIKVVMENYPNRIQVNMRLKSGDDSPIKFTLEAIGLYDHVGEDPEKDRTKIFDFLRMRGLHMLWSYLSQMVQLITGQMGMNPIKPNVVLEFNVESLEKALMTQ